MNDPQTVLQRALSLAPEVRLHSTELYFPASVDWYLARVQMMYPQGYLVGPTVPVVVTATVNDGTISTQSYTDPLTGEQYLSGDPYGNTPFYLKIVDPQTESGEISTENGTIILGDPECYFGYVEDPSAGVADFVYGFFYAYNGEVGNDPGFFGWHEGDWEHIVVRTTLDLSEVLGIYFQAHRQSDQWSHWYFPPGTTGDVSCYSVNDSGHPIVYSSNQGHSSYTAPGDYYYGFFRGTDVADGAGLVWSTWENLVEFPAFVSWMAYNGYWGDGGVDGYGPISPGFQDWLQPRTDGPTVYTSVSVNTAQAAHNKSRVSGDFTLNLPQATVEWKITDLPDESLASGFTFAVMEDKGNDKPRLTGVTDGTTSPGVLTTINPSKMYIGRLTYTDPTNGQTYSGMDVFTHLGITAFTITVAPIPVAPTATEERERMPLAV